jgi:hypothetical protein
LGGANGWLRLADFVHPASIHEPSFEVNGAVEKVKICDCSSRHTDSLAPAQDSQMFRNFAQQAATGNLNEEWPMWSLKTQQVMDACHQSALHDGRPVSLE